MKRCDEERAELKAEALDLLVFIPMLNCTSRALGSDQRNIPRVQAANKSFLRMVAGFSLRDRMKSSVIWEEPVLLRIEKSQMRLEAPGKIWDPLERLFLLASLGMPWEGLNELGRGKSGPPSLTSSRKWMDAWHTNVATRGLRIN